MAKISFDQAYRGWRNQARMYSRRSILSKAFDAINASDTNTVEGLRHAPWNISLMVKWVCQDKWMNSRTDISDDQFHALRQALWDLPHGVDIRGGGISIQQFFRLLINPQIGFQRRMGYGFIREAAMLERLQANSSVRSYFSERTGLEPSEYIDLAVATFALVVSGQDEMIRLESYAPFIHAYGELKVRKFLSLFSANVEELISFFQSFSDRDRKVVSEYFEFPAIKKLPMLKLEGRYYCWHKMVLYRGLDDFVHSVLREDERVMRKFTDIFEGYVVSEAKRLQAVFFGENELSRWLPKDSKVPDGLISFSDANVFLESKAGAFDEVLMTLGTAAMLRDRTRAVAKAIVQARSAASGLRQTLKAPQSVTDQKTDYLLVVTNKELALGSGKKLAEMYPQEDGVPWPECETLPLSNIFFVSIGDFERLVSGCVLEGLLLSDVLAEFVRLDSDATTSVFFFEQHLTRRGFLHDVSPMIEGAKEGMLERVRRMSP